MNWTSEIAERTYENAAPGKPHRALAEETVTVRRSYERSAREALRSLVELTADRPADGGLLDELRREFPTD